MPTVKDTLKELGGTTAFSTFAKQILKQGLGKRPNKRIFDNTKISDHFAIIPTLQTPKQLNEAEQKLYDMVVRRPSLAVVSTRRRNFLQTTRITQSGGASLSGRKGKGAAETRAGLPCNGRAVGDETENPAGHQPRGEQVAIVEVAEKANQTKPPPRYSEGPRCSRRWKGAGQAGRGRRAA